MLPRRAGAGGGRHLWTCPGHWSTARSFSTGIDRKARAANMSTAISRREAMRRGVLSAAALTLGERMGFGAPVAARPAKAKAVIQIWMWGGPCHLDTFDPKPEAGNDYTGPLNKPIATNVDGVRLCELLPELAGQADKYSLIRSMTHGNNAHETASYM